MSERGRGRGRGRGRAKDSIGVGSKKELVCESEYCHLRLKILGRAGLVNYIKGVATIGTCV